MVAAIFSEKMLLIVLTLFGMALCSLGIGQVTARSAWLQPISLLTSAIGVLILLVVGAGLFGYRLPLVPNTGAAIIAVLVLVTIKLVPTQLHRLV
jgi:hypothetical protein